VLVLLGVLVGVVVLAMWSVPANRPLSVPPSSFEPWLALPTEPMDARNPETRRLIGGAMDWDDADGSRHGDSYETLAFRCGRHDRQTDADQPREIYIARMVESMLQAEPAPWRVEMTPGADSVRVRIVEAWSLAPRMPPLPPTRSIALRMPRSALASIQQAWSAPALWQPLPPDEKQCLDGSVTLLEACVEGRYFVSQRQCGYGAPEARKLLALFRRTLPPPQ